ncbi:MAG: DUF3078 domain-containing protein [Saprospiraceae bacterium]|nr:DUF3078 domain-containing protein [Saprospiraceae bacterium]MCB0623654.1 DUF3078 domain-containing protein [Saprospiraceae bacterium]MCB0676648.1 DUF3078 domain-containing protein [Saprospiraceae bacterium]MCB0683623.1 DUF3078 domain-containing protein [Saprospiraceae bacterium]
MKKGTLLFLLCLFVTPALLVAQAGDDRLGEIKAAAAEEVEEGWVYGGGVGLDFAQLALFQPRVGAGDNRIGFGGLVNLFANHKKDRFFWNNEGSLQLAAQRIGGKDADFQKNLDLIRLASRLGYRAGEGKMYLALEGNLRTLLLPTYEGNVLSPPNDGDMPIAKLFSPVQVVVSPGVEYKYDDHLAFFLSPASMKLIYVADDSIAALNVHGNDAGKNSFLALGATFKTTYTNKFLDDRLSYATSLDLFSNYLENPQNIDVLWTNELSIQIFKNLSINLVTEYFYDDDVDVQFDLDKDGIIGEPADQVDGYDRPELGPSSSFTEAILIKYNFIF